MRRFMLPPIVMLVCAAAMAVLYRAFPLPVLVAPPWHWAGLLPLSAGIGLAQWHARLFRRIGTNINTFGEPGQLTTAGLFARTRNPMYLGMLTALAGLAWLLGSLACWLPVAVFALLAQFWYIPLEERALSAKFGAQFEAYRRRVPRWLL